MCAHRRDGVSADGPSDREIEERLLALRREYLSRAGKIASDIGEGLPRDAEERAIALENADVLDALQREALEEAQKVDAALERLRAGTYGLCAGCGESIADARLRAYPAASRCISCLEAEEG